MGCPSDCNIGQNLKFSVTTHHPTTGELLPADELPTYSVFKGTSNTPIIEDAVMAVQGSVDIGHYKAIIVCSGANFNTDGENYSILVRAIVATEPGGTSFDFKIRDSYLKSAELKQLRGAIGIDGAKIDPEDGYLQLQVGAVVSEIKDVVDAIQLITDAIPDDGAMTSIAQETTVEGVGAAVAVVLDAVGANNNLLTHETYGLAALNTAIGGVPAATLAVVVDGSADVKTALKYILSYCVGKITRLGTAYTYRNFDDTADIFVNTTTQVPPNGHTRTRTDS